MGVSPKFTNDLDIEYGVCEQGAYFSKVAKNILQMNNSTDLFMPFFFFGSTTCYLSRERSFVFGSTVGYVPSLVKNSRLDNSERLARAVFSSVL